MALHWYLYFREPVLVTMSGKMLTSENVSLEMLIPGKGMAAVRAKDHVDGKVCSEDRVF